MLNETDDGPCLSLATQNHHSAIAPDATACDVLDIGTDPPFYPGLILYVCAYNGPRTTALTLFYSCAQQNLKVDIQNKSVGGTWNSYLFIQGKLVSIGERALTCDIAESCALRDAVSRLKKKQPFKDMPIHIPDGPFLCDHHVIPGLVLYFKNPSQPEDEWLDVLQQSCKQCHLSLSWWHYTSKRNGKCDAVLMIDSRPVCWGQGKSMKEAIYDAVVIAISAFELSQPVRYDEDDSGCKGRITQTNSVSPAEQSMRELMDEVNKESKQHLPAAIPNLKLYLPPQQSEKAENNPAVTLLNSLIRSQMDVRLDTVFCCEPHGILRLYMTKLLIQDTVVVSGHGGSLNEAYFLVWKKALEVLMITQQVVYAPGHISILNSSDCKSSNEPLNKLTNMTNQLSEAAVTQQKIQRKTCLETPIPGLTLYLPNPGSNCVQDPQSIIEKGAANRKMKVELKSMLNKSRTEYATKLLIRDTVVAWGYGKTLKCAHKKVWEEALKVLTRLQPVYYHNKQYTRKPTENIDSKDTQAAEKSRKEQELAVSSLSFKSGSLGDNIIIKSPVPLCNDREDLGGRNFQKQEGPFVVLSEWRKTSEETQHISNEAIDRYITRYIQKSQQEYHTIL